LNFFSYIFLIFLINFCLNLVFLFIKIYKNKKQKSWPPEPKSWLRYWLELYKSCVKSCTTTVSHDNKTKGGKMSIYWILNKMRSTWHDEEHPLIWEMNDKCDCRGKMSAGVGRGNGFGRVYGSWILTSKERVYIRKIFLHNTRHKWWDPYE
jgi:hypothetical protein